MKKNLPKIWACPNMHIQKPFGNVYTANVQPGSPLVIHHATLVATDDAIDSLHAIPAMQVGKIKQSCDNCLYIRRLWVL